MERRVLIAVFLSFLVLYGYQSFVVPRPPAAPVVSPEPAAPTTPDPQIVAPSPQQAPVVPPVADSVAPASVLADTIERQIVVETATVQATLSNRGGRIVRWRLKDYRDNRGEPVDLVPSSLPADQPTPFSLRV